jgi:exonuclease III
LGDDAANESPILSLIFNEISEILVNKEYEFKQRSECPEDKYDRNIVLEWFGVSQPDIIIGNETWLNKNVLSSEVFPSTLFEDVFRNDRDSRESGGVLIAIKKDIICQEVFKSEKVELIAGPQFDQFPIYLSYL